jgi:adenine phosphoribosyltransferase
MVLTPRELAGRIRDIQDFPIPGIVFRDITTLLKDPLALRSAIEHLTEPFRHRQVDLVVGVESRGFIFAAPIAQTLGAGFIPVRKLGKLPGESVRVEYALEYGTNVLEIHQDAIQPGQRVLIVDDLLATGGTALAAIELVQKLGGQVVASAFLVELTFLEGRERLAGHEVTSVISY